MDADDIADPQRFMKQEALLDAQPATGVCGSWVRLVGDGPQMLVRYPRTHEGVAAGMLFRTQVANPSVMMRTALFREQGGFNPDYNQAEDYEFWSRVLFHTRFAILPEALLQYRAHPAQVGRMHAAEQRQRTQEIQEALLRKLGIEPSPEERSLHQSLGWYRWEATREYLARVDAWLRRVRDANAGARIFDARALDDTVGALWFSVCAHATALGLAAWRVWRASPLGALHAPAGEARARFLVNAARRKRR
ncbi:MAG: hypothetical protein IPP94_13685 [Ignavibacteria bacterium]|nr:hypothetical protein [Ignavibacteria bacterium]